MIDKINNYGEFDGKVPSDFKSFSDQKTLAEHYAELNPEEFGYITIRGEYYWMEYKGYCPGMTQEEVREKFNTCFGHQWLSFRDGKFHLKVNTD